MNQQFANSERFNFLGRYSFGNNNASSHGSSRSQTKAEDENLLSDVEGKVKTRLMSMWNNVKYGWTVKLKTNFSKESPVWLLGRCYHRKPDLSDASTELGTDAAHAQEAGHDIEEGEGIEGFKQDFISRLWLTYRREFPVLNGSAYSSDCGWGCMLRSGQMLLAQGLVCHFLGRGWRWNPEQSSLTREQFTEDSYHRMIIKWFGDKPSHNSPLSIHALVTLGEASGKKPGDWYGPAFVAHLLRQAVRQASKENHQLDNVNVYVAQDCAVYVQDILDECTDGDDNKWKALILLIPLRLGADKLNLVYAPCLTTLLSHENCIGVIGGRPKHSLYFVGYQDDKLIHLDPHYCQEMVDVWASGFPVSSFHCRSPRKMHLNKMDPSCCIGFYCSTKADFLSFKKSITPFLVPPSTQPKGCAAEYPMFVFCEGRSCDALAPRVAYLATEDQCTPPSYPHDENFESEEFEIV